MSRKLKKDAGVRVREGGREKLVNKTKKEEEEGTEERGKRRRVEGGRGVLRMEG